MARALRNPQGKLATSVQDAVLGLDSGMCVAVSGFGLSSNPEALIDAVLDLGVSQLTLVSNNAGSMGRGLARWIQAGIVERFIGTYVGTNEDLQQAIQGGSIEVELIPQGTFAERLRAAGAGIAAFYTPTGVGSDVAQGKETRSFDGREHVLEVALPVDFAFVRAHRADRFGNVRFYGTSRNFAPAMAMAATVAIAEADQVVELGGIAPDDVHLPGVFIQRVVEVTHHEDPIEVRTVRPR